MVLKHSTAWYCQSANKEADERGSRASISIDSLRLSESDPPTTELSQMVRIARQYFVDLHTPEDNPPDRINSKIQLLQEMSQEYKPKLAPTNVNSRSFSLGEVLALAGKMPNTAPGPNSTHYRFWKSLAARTKNNDMLPSFWDVFQDLTDDIRSQGTGRCHFKDANISLFYKKGDPTLTKNYRPISSMNTDCKMWSNLINRRLATWAVNKLHPDQKGFIPQRYITEHTRLAKMVAHLSNATRTNGYIVSLDQAKAYN